MNPAAEVVKTVTEYLPAAAIGATAAAFLLLIRALLLAILARRRRTRHRPDTGTASKPANTSSGSAWFYIAAAVSLLVSLNTSWRFFGERLHITGTVERASMFAVIEVLLFACAAAMRANVRKPGGKAGKPRLLMWGLCAAAAYMAWDLSGPIEGSARVLLGPVACAMAIHLALGVDIRHRRLTEGDTKRSIGERLASQWGERALSLLGVADADTRDAAARTRDRAAQRVVRIATSRHALFRSRRLVRAVRASGIGSSDARMVTVIRELSAATNATQLAGLQMDAPWAAYVPTQSQAGSKRPLPTAPPVTTDQPATSPEQAAPRATPPKPSGKAKPAKPVSSGVSLSAVDDEAVVDAIRRAYVAKQIDGTKLTLDEAQAIDAEVSGKPHGRSRAIRLLRAAQDAVEQSA